MAKRKMILDLDTGIDDSLAIAYALGAPDVDLIGIMGSYGNVYVEDGAKNALKILELLGHTDIPVYVGESHSSTSDHFDRMQVSANIHGENGIGQVDLPDPKRPIEKESAVDFLIDAVHQYGKDLTLVPTGPMTNLAAALKKAPEIATEIGNVTFMGGALTVPGNVTFVAEANINQDAEAANAVLTSPLHSTMVGLDVTLRTLLTRKETQQWRDLGTKSGEKFADIVDYYIEAYRQFNDNLGGCALHDPLAVGVALDPSFVQTLDLNMLVKYGKEDYGRTIGDDNRLNEPTNVKVSVQVDTDRYLKTFMDYLTNLFKQN
ncbi:nucleoside hydrolase [Levilactobacillus zymae]|uniref:Inosine-uridine preferring nucleoside hydrolase n=1 Tax=Levilactobacillus zymae TaxID=267363 RepID=A0A1Y6JYD7_9LACO|nr:nucleoside hydrolase [Levilactobacillus zymae]KRL11232.1 inosine-uridine nucleoside N-ribohydrolase [Levilactobacillus zymae DSM 19395]QFR60124.1 nucleoside hydrolase [Levilactobacillus zymae]GEO71435.1 purine nucleosidase [Levilactobacillus zymae]SMS14875.1 Inosine-uridine preferring nucleoside hydrolase [Levilactobacillus zymae]